MKKKWRSKSDYFKSDLPMLSMSILEEYVHGITQSKFSKIRCMEELYKPKKIWSIWKKCIGLGIPWYFFPMDGRKGRINLSIFDFWTVVAAILQWSNHKAEWKFQICKVDTTSGVFL